MLNKINTQVLEVVKRLNDIQENDLDFETREGYIVANIKCYDYLDSSDVEEYCKTKGLSEKLTKKVLKEFDADRLYSIEQHTREWDVSFLKEKYQENCDINDIEAALFVHKIANWYVSIEEALEKCPDRRYFITRYWNEAKARTYEEYKDFIKSECEYSWDEFYRRKDITFDCFTLGRSGGWFSICKEDSVDLDMLANNYGWGVFDDLNGAEDDKEFNEIFNQYVDRETKKDFIKTCKAYIKEFEQTVKNIQYYINEIEEGKKYFKENLLQRLHDEIEEFLYERDNKNKPNVTIRIEEGLIKTSLGVTVQLDEFRKAFKVLSPIIEATKKGEKFKIHQRVGSYHVEYATKKKKDFIIKAGCHRFSYNQIKETLSCI